MTRSLDINRSTLEQHTRHGMPQEGIDVDYEQLYVNIAWTASERDPHSYEATKAIAKKAQKTLGGFSAMPTLPIFFATALVAS